MRKLITFIILFSLIVSSVGISTVHAEGDIKVAFNGKNLEFEVNPYIKDGVTMVPFRKILEAFGAQVGWDGTQKVVAAKKAGAEIYMKIGINYAYLNGDEVNIEVAPEVKDGSTFVPLRFISENLGAEVSWINATRTVDITYIDAVYKLGQQGSYKGFNFTIDSSNIDSKNGTLVVKGKMNSTDKNITMEISDDYGYVLTEPVNSLKKADGTYEIDTSFNVPTCHNFEAKRIILKLLNEEKKLVKIAEYEI